MSKLLRLTQIESPIGPITILQSNKGVMKIEYKQLDNYINDTESKNVAYEIISPEVSTAAKQITEYFNGLRKTFDVSLDIAGTDFQKKVWQAMLTIPFGHPLTYKDIAIKVGSPKGCRAVGQACGANPIPIIIPCHRVVGANNSMGGYSGGIHIKQYLLSFESKF